MEQALVAAAVSPACRILIGGIFAVSALSKIVRYDRFRAALHDLRVPAALGPAVVAAEVSVLVAMAWRPLSPGGFAVATGLLAGFTAVIVRAVRRGAATSCGCFGLDASPIGYAEVWRNGFLAIPAVLGFASSIVAPGGPVAAQDWLLAGPVAVSLIPVYVFLPELVRLLRTG